MSIKSRIQDLATQHHETLAELERKLGMGNGTITRWDKRYPSSEKLTAVANHYNVTTDYILGRTDTPQFTQKDERDVQKTLEDLIQGLNNKSSLAYMKNGDQEIDPEDAELLAASLENVVRQSKLLAKQKFTPKKYRKNKDQ